MHISIGLEEGQVLQRSGAAGATVHLSGESSPAGPILATISGTKGVLKGWKARSIGKSVGGKFVLTLKGIPAGGPYRLDLSAGKEKAIRRAFFVGDVWVLAGQSNMEGVGNMTAPAKSHPHIRACSMRREWRLATDPLHVLGESPDACHRDKPQLSPPAAEEMRRKAQKGVSAGIFFAREMLQRSGVPQGLIVAAHGGTSMSQWDPGLKDSMYASMLQSVLATGQPVAGVLWYQGESDANPNDLPLYTERMKKLVAATRRDFRQASLPWVIVQISRFHSPRDKPTSWNGIQEVQRLLPGKIPNLATVAAIDLPLDDAIHIGATGFPRLGSRLAHAAAALVYGEKKQLPQLREIVFGPTSTEECVDVIFDGIEKELQSEGEPQGFTLLDADGQVAPIIYKVTLHGNTARLHCGSSPKGLSLHYGHGYVPVCNITDGRGMSLPVFGSLPPPTPQAFLPFVTTWKTTGIITTPTPLVEIGCPDLESFETSIKTYVGSLLDGFIDEHHLWQGKPGQAYFGASLKMAEPMKLRFLMGYDGPFCLWVDGQLFFQDLKGTNPTLRDQHKKSISLSAGTHRITVAMDLNEGRAWGFILRFLREDLTRAQVKAKEYATPSYSV